LLHRVDPGAGQVAATGNPLDNLASLTYDQNVREIAIGIDRVPGAGDSITTLNAGLEHSTGNP
jgi:hypothetical protein